MTTKVQECKCHYHMTTFRDSVELFVRDTIHGPIPHSMINGWPTCWPTCWAARHRCSSIPVSPRTLLDMIHPTISYHAVSKWQRLRHYSLHRYIYHGPLRKSLAPRHASKQGKSTPTTLTNLMLIRITCYPSRCTIRVHAPSASLENAQGEETS